MFYKAAIFDMDGLLLDTEKVCQQAFYEACDYLSVPILEDVYLRMIGSNEQGIKEIISQGYGPSLDYDALRVEWMKRYHAVVYHQPIAIKEGVVELLDWLKKQSIPIAIATSSDKKVSRIKLELSGLLPYFETFSNGCEVEKSKPSPEIFLLAATRLNVEPEFCLAFEDSSNGVRSAIAAGMIVYQIPDLVKPSPEICALGHQIKGSLSEVLSILKQQ